MEKSAKKGVALLLHRYRASIIIIIIITIVTSVARKLYSVSLLYSQPFNIFEIPRRLFSTLSEVLNNFVGSSISGIQTETEG